MLKLSLPYPPSINSYWRHFAQKTKGGVRYCVLISEEGRAYRETIKKEIEALGDPKIESKSLSVFIYVAPPDKRRRDLDNLTKALLDSLQHAGVFVDDFHIDALMLKRCEPIDDGRVIVKIFDISTEKRPELSVHI